MGGPIKTAPGTRQPANAAAWIFGLCYKPRNSSRLGTVIRDFYSTVRIFLLIGESDVHSRRMFLCEIYKRTVQKFSSVRAPLKLESTRKSPSSPSTRTITTKISYAKHARAALRKIAGRGTVNVVTDAPGPGYAQSAQNILKGAVSYGGAVLFPRE